MPWADVITDQPGACLGSQAWAKHDVTRLHTNSEVRVKCNASMHQAITLIFQPGEWKVKTLYDDTVLGLSVKSAPRDPSNYPILAFSFWGDDQLFADDCADEQTMYTLVTRGMWRYPTLENEGLKKECSLCHVIQNCELSESRYDINME